MARISKTRLLLGIWAILSILWATFYVAVTAVVGDHLAFEQVVADILTPISALLIICGIAAKILRGTKTAEA